MICFSCLPYKYSNIYLIKEDEFITRVFLNDTSFLYFFEKFRPVRNDLILNDEITQLAEYLNGKRKKFNIKFKLLGTEFQKLIWDRILCIEYADVKTYSDIAIEIKMPSAARAVGSTCRKNVLPIIVPCHRVVSKKDMGGFFGKNSEFLIIKSYLLNLERAS
ncbi:methylated-DNA-[protein]-cysteine S-methyltransferase [Thermodesulfobium acidiphilum]|uniref:Methylated-DNA-[protein]-cysteine S-methyltransferase n=1 Tax=Thermodesulfobium acidiphilum TaxID=1794699 RepID=A0A2R4VYA3_THEAF|nr:methylated-DNA--[protein]-cysteine S-methyltransferase [Thermodesulfobium acidiphilum]AWB09436.1 methylated-DNA-[protein]-cysteine S-methyltransferase [Thermodesulfobium acidiphilum]